MRLSYKYLLHSGESVLTDFKKEQVVILCMYVCLFVCLFIRDYKRPSRIVESGSIFEKRVISYITYKHRFFFQDNQILTEKPHIVSCRPDFAQNEVLARLETLKQTIAAPEAPAIPTAYKVAVSSFKDTGVDIIAKFPELKNIKSTLYNHRNAAFEVDKFSLKPLKKWKYLQLTKRNPPSRLQLRWHPYNSILCRMGPASHAKSKRLFVRWNILDMCATLLSTLHHPRRFRQYSQIYKYCATRLRPHEPQKSKSV